MGLQKELGFFILLSISNFWCIYLNNIYFLKFSILIFSMATLIPPPPSLPTLTDYLRPSGSILLQVVAPFVKAIFIKNSNLAAARLSLYQHRQQRQPQKHKKMKKLHCLTAVNISFRLCLWFPLSARLKVYPNLSYNGLKQTHTHTHTHAAHHLVLSFSFSYFYPFCSFIFRHSFIQFPHSLSSIIAYFWGVEQCELSICRRHIMRN